MKAERDEGFVKRLKCSKVQGREKRMNMERYEEIVKRLKC